MGDSHQGLCSLCTTAFKSEVMMSPHLPPDGQETMSEVAYPSSRSRFRQPARHSSGAMLPLRRLDTLREVPSVDVLDESTNNQRDGTGAASRAKSSSSDPRLPAPRRRPRSSIDDSGSADNLRNWHHETDLDEEEQPLSPPPAWAAESRDSVTQNPLFPQPQ